MERAASPYVNAYAASNSLCIPVRFTHGAKRPCKAIAQTSQKTSKLSSIQQLLEGPYSWSSHATIRLLGPGFYSAEPCVVPLSTCTGYGPRWSELTGIPDSTNGRLWPFVNKSGSSMIYLERLLMTLYVFGSTNS
ncbi:hypothetical protein NA56DRAFT_696157 [Hyaloscypha hepaticicola]|uniref:Uncharacterized protein n=1 Tax=Hyaloscypha hepaticicola TaxID=2082293 RepID=A0A2J6QQ51_9HELO|nr:hypothetical protein NA56DRAFT_696157 [Hyaloscypha hepaticicola]